MTNPRDFSDLHVVVTGGTGFLGAAVVGRLLDAGAICHVPCFSAAEIERFAYREHQRVRLRHPVDLSDEQAVETFYDGLPSLWASIHCAGGFTMRPIAETSADILHQQLATNVISCFLCCREAIKAIRRSGDGGRVVNVAARPALEPRGGSGMTAYTLSKSAVSGLTQALAEEVAGEGIWVNAVAPGVIDTPPNRTAMPEADVSRWPGVDELAATMVFLASPANLATRGGVVPVYGRS